MKVTIEIRFGSGHHEYPTAEDMVNFDEQIDALQHAVDGKPLGLLEQILVFDAMTILNAIRDEVKKKGF